MDERAHPLRMGENHGSESSGNAKRLKYLRSCSIMEKKRHPPSIQQRTEQNKYMKDKRIEKVKQHYFISLNDERFKILKHKIDPEKALLTIRTKVFGQNFPRGDNILVSTSDDNEPSFVVAWKGTWKDEKVECWEYKIIT